MKLYMIRHGKTAGNQEHRYVGSTDEGILDEVKQTLRPVNKDVRCVYTSPMKRCLETAALLFPKAEPVRVPAFREMDFGDFEYRNFPELEDHPAYQAYLRTNGEAAFPNGESKASFTKRVAETAETLFPVWEREESVYCVLHGGTIMALLNVFSEPHRDYFSWSCKPGCGYVCELIKADNRYALMEIRPYDPVRQAADT
jgi:alpha-ribazole phosphatase